MQKKTSPKMVRIIHPIKRMPCSFPIAKYLPFDTVADASSINHFAVKRGVKFQEVANQ